MKKYHYYPNKSKTGKKKGFPLTACGKDGSNVGGLILGFFDGVSNKQRCKTCNKIFQKEKFNETTTT